MIREDKDDNKLVGKKVEDNTKIVSEQENTNVSSEQEDIHSEYKSTEAAIVKEKKTVSKDNKTRNSVKKTNIADEGKKKSENITKIFKKENKTVDNTVVDNIVKDINSSNGKNINNTGKGIDNTKYIICGSASLKKCIIAPRKVRMIANMLRGKKLNRIFGILSCNQKRCCSVLKKLLFAALANYEKNCEKNDARSVSEMEKLFLYKITVDNGGMLKRILPASQGRAFRIRKRFSHINAEIREC